MRVVRFSVFLACFTTVLIPSADLLRAYQAARYARVSGTLRLPSGETEPPGMVQVTLTTVSGAFVESKTLSSETSFSFNRVDHGEYLVTVESPGFQPTSQVLDIDAPYRDVMIMVTLGPRLPSRSDETQPGGQTVNVKTLTLPPAVLKEFQKGEREAKKGNPDEALDHFRKVLESSPDYFPAYEALGMQYAALQRWEEAIQALEKAIEYHPENPKARRNLAQLYLSQTRYDAAVEHLNAAAVIEPNHSKTWMLLGEGYLGLGECPTALDYFLAAAEIDEKDHSYLGIGQCYLRTGQVTEALQEFRGFLAKNPKDPRAASVRQFISRVEKDQASNPKH